MMDTGSGTAKAPGAGSAALLAQPFATSLFVICDVQFELDYQRCKK